MIAGLTLVCCSNSETNIGDENTEFFKHFNSGSRLILVFAKICILSSCFVSSHRNVK